MGFYGNITNTSRTQFVFDRTYPNRYVMDKSCETDGVYAGRYVLVEYDTDLHDDIFKTKWYYVNNKMYTQVLKHNEDKGLCGPVLKTLVTAKDITAGDVVKIPEGNQITMDDEPKYIIINGTTSSSFIYTTEANYITAWKESGKTAPNLSKEEDLHAHIQDGVIVNFDPETMPIGTYLCAPAGYSYSIDEGDNYYMAIIEDGQEEVKWRQIDTSTTDNYFGNSNFDRAHYGSSRGYDSTVWQKVYTNSPDATTGSPNTGRYEKYVMIAELNTVVPTFDICADAPSLIPTSPHFDTDSTNIYYRFHWQPQWGLRIKSASNALYGPKIATTGEPDSAATVNMTSDSIVYPSDQQTAWKGKFYNAGTDTSTESYYNQFSKGWTDKDIGETTMFDAAIYYNKAGFDPKNVTYSSDIIKINEKLGKPYASYNQSIYNSGWTNEDAIKLSPTGLSGHTYKQHNHISDMAAQEDTQEFSFMLPSLGNSIAQIWDIIYGGRDTNSYIAETSRRNLDINWEDAADAIQRNGLRLVTTKENGNGYSLTDNEVNTVAGAINSVHDLMGMIIVDVDNADNQLSAQDMIDNADENNIYYYESDGSFKRKHKTFDYEELAYQYKIITLDEDSYFKDFYYLDNSGNTVATDLNFDPNQTYYVKSLTINQLNDLYKTVDLEGWKSDTYYYKTLNGEYHKAKNALPSNGTQYYSFKSASPINLDGAYKVNSVFYVDSVYNGATTYKLEGPDENGPKPDRQYYKIPQTDIVKVNLNMENANLYDASTGLYGKERLKYFYVPNKFYYVQKKKDSNGNELNNYIMINQSVEDMIKAGYFVNGKLQLPVLDENGNPVESNGEIVYRQPLMLEFEENSSQSYDYVVQKDGSILQILNMSTGSVTITGIYEVDLYQFTENTFYYVSGQETYIDELGNIQALYNQYTGLTWETLLSLYNAQFIVSGTKTYANFYKIKIEPQGSFYTANTFWYKTNDGNYVKDKASQSTVGRQYYNKIEFDKLDKTFYVPNEYYTLDENSGLYNLETSSNFDMSKQYYLKDNIYVIEDSYNLYAPGTVWTTSMTEIPASVSLGRRTERYEMIELEGFARTLNTIHGLILKINQKMEFNDSNTRDRNTVQGALNTLNDYIDRFKYLPSNRFVITDSYGKMEGAYHSTAQEYFTSNWQNSILEDNRIEATEDRWIDFELNSNPNDPYFTIKHRLTKVDDTTTISDKNKPLTDKDSATALGNNNTDSDTLDLLTPIVDNAGHIVGQNKETITLPYSYKFFTAENNDIIRDSINVVNNQNTIADNTKDTFNFITYNKWLQLDSHSKDTFVIGHKFSGVKPGNYGLRTSLNISDLDVQQDENVTWTIHAADGTVSTKVVNEGHDKNTFNIPYFTVDEAGHITSAVTNKITLPENFTEIGISEVANIFNENFENPNSIKNTGGTIAADTLTDKLLLELGNKWINMVVDEDNDKITIKHYVNKFSEKPGTSDFNSNNETTFDIQLIEWDDAGHIIKSTKTKYTLPKNIKTLKVDNTGSNKVAMVSASKTDIIAENPIDEVTFDTGNRWITLAASTNSKTINIAHAAAGTAINSKGDTAAQTPNFGDTFKVPSLGIDETGHVKTLEEHTVTIPSPSLSDVALNGADVITQLSLNSETGRLSTTRSNIGALLLTGYNSEEVTAVVDILATDTLNQALEKLQFNLKHLSPQINITKSTADDSTGIQISINGQLSDIKYLDKASLDNYGVVKLSDSVESDDSTLAATSKAVNKVYLLANEKVNFSSEFKYGTSNEEEEPTVEEESSETTEEDLVTEDETSEAKTIQWLFNKVAELEQTIQELTKQP